MAFRTGILIMRSASDDDPLIFDCTIESNHTMQAEITTNPIETNDGDVTDHRRTKPTQYRFRGMFVNEADGAKAADRAMSANDDRDPLGSARANGPQINQVRCIDMLERLKAIFKSQAVVTVYTDLEVLENAVLEALDYRVLSAELDAITAAMTPSAIEVSGTFRQLRFATTSTVELPAEPVKNQVGKKQQRGTVQGKPANDEIKAKSKSILKAFTGGL
jgi:hypothetical protein